METCLSTAKRHIQLLAVREMLKQDRLASISMPVGLAADGSG